jgi:hypothetical protein
MKRRIKTLCLTWRLVSILHARNQRILITAWNSFEFDAMSSSPAAQVAQSQVGTLSNSTPCQAARLLKWHNRKCFMRCAAMCVFAFPYMQCRMIRPGPHKIRSSTFPASYRHIGRIKNGHYHLGLPVKAAGRNLESACSVQHTVRLLAY